MQSVRFVFRTICPPLIKTVRTICLRTVCPRQIRAKKQSVRFVFRTICLQTKKITATPVAWIVGARKSSELLLNIEIRTVEIHIHMMENSNTNGDKYKYGWKANKPSFWLDCGWVREPCTCARIKFSSAVRRPASHCTLGYRMLHTLVQLLRSYGKHSMAFSWVRS